MIFGKDDGYTYVEIIIAISIMTLISSIIIINSTTISESVSRGRNKLELNYEKLRLIEILSCELENIKTPWLSKDHKYTINGNSMEIFYYKGDPNQSIILDSSADGITIIIGKIPLFHFESLIGKFEINESTVIFKIENREFKFNLGVSIA